MPQFEGKEPWWVNYDRSQRLTNTTDNMTVHPATTPPEKAETTTAVHDDRTRVYSPRTRSAQTALPYHLSSLAPFTSKCDDYENPSVSIWTETNSVVQEANDISSSDEEEYLGGGEAAATFAGALSSHPRGNSFLKRNSPPPEYRVAKGRPDMLGTGTHAQNGNADDSQDEKFREKLRDKLAQQEEEERKAYLVRRAAIARGE
ncbi:hypothetical protein QFC21_005107 [Naganishia friedmannii]|uniref:Uncharacterized protein n=1 Tax=Naganishia friedmannii TaxID=89922 RepID=A0ACC2VDZ4_9TREE|nr:hypothetical protein QFC21_005107 [Naganishia friedmannii]